MAAPSNPLSAGIQSIRAAAAQPTAPVQSTANMLDRMANMIVQHRFSPNEITTLANDITSNAVMLANTIYVNSGAQPPRGVGTVINSVASFMTANADDPDALLEYAEDLRRSANSQAAEANQP